MNILFLTSRLPYPPFRGDKLKIYNLIRQLSNRHRVTLLSFISDKDELKYIKVLREYCAEIKTVHLRPLRSAFNCLLNVFSPLPFQVAYYDSKEMYRLIMETIHSTPFDIIHVHLIRMVQYAANDHDLVPRVLDLTDAGSLYLERFLSVTTHPVRKFLIREELKRLKNYEKRIESFNQCLVCSEVDKEVLLRHAPQAKINLLYNGIDLDYFQPNIEHHADPYRIICTGNMSYFPNVDGILYFLKEIFPAIKAQVKGVKVFIVGKDPPFAVRRQSGDDVIVTGFVRDIKEHYLQSTVAIAPIRFGAGTLNKILEPMALGIPVVTSSIGVEGLPVRDGKDLLIADTPKEFANSVIRVLQDRNLQRQLSENSKSIVHPEFDWKVIAHKLESYYCNLR